MPLVNGTLTDFGLDPLTVNNPTLFFRASSTGVAGLNILSARKAVEVTPAANGYFEAELVATAAIAPADTHYIIELRYRSEDTGMMVSEVLPWKLFVPSEGGALGDLLRVPANPALVFTGTEPPTLAVAGTWWLDSATGDLSEFDGEGWQHKAALRGPAGYNATGAAEDDAAVAAFIIAASGSTATRDALQAKFASVQSVAAKFGNDSTDATAHIQAVNDAANTAGLAVYVPAGTYRVSAPIEDVRRMYLAEGAKIVASTAGMEAVLRQRVSTRFDGGYIIGGGTIDANTNAGIGLHVRNFLHFKVFGIIVKGGNIAAIKGGSSAASGRSAELMLKGLRLINEGPTVIAGSRGILIENSGDHGFDNIVIQNYEYGVTLPVAGNAMQRDVHAWCEPAKGLLHTGFEDYSNNTHYDQCHADTPAYYGFRMYGYQCSFSQSGTYMNPSVTAIPDGQAVGIRFEAANAIASVMQHFFLGGSGTRRLKADIETADGNYGLIQWGKCSNQNIIPGGARTLYDKSIGLSARDTITAGKGFIADATAPIADLGLIMRTAGLSRWALVTDGAAEAGSNAGTGLSCRRYSDTGAMLGEVFFISRSSGTFVWKTHQSIGDGFNIVLGSVTGTMFGTNAAQKIGFFGNAPVVKPAALTAADATTVDATYGAEEQAVITNMRTRINQLEARLQLIGLLG